MKATRNYPRATVSKKAENSIRGGHPWIYDTEIREDLSELDNGCLMDVFSEKDAYLGTGLLSQNSKIRIRLLSSNANDRYDEAFFRRRIEYAIRYRRTVMREADFSCCRILFGESDGLPGVTVDRYGSILVSEVLSYGMELRKDMLFRILKEEMERAGATVDGIYERNESAIRELEGLGKGKGWYAGEGFPVPGSSVTEIMENGIRYLVDVENGQKTGFFLDQKLNRRAAAGIAAGKHVLDCFTHTGSFGLNAAAAGAEHVTCVDVSKTAIDLAMSNAERNGLVGRMDFICADVFDLLPKLAEEHADYDYIILDPPAFTKNRATVRNAGRGYKEINFRAMKLLPRGGYLATCSCSHFMTKEMFLEMLRSAARDAGVSLKLIEARGQSPDHPVLLNVPETDYLKFFLLQIV